MLTCIRKQNTELFAGFITSESLWSRKQLLWIQRRCLYLRLKNASAVIARGENPWQFDIEKWPRASKVAKKGKANLGNSGELQPLPQTGKCTNLIERVIIADHQESLLQSFPPHTNKYWLQRLFQQSSQRNGWTWTLVYVRLSVSNVTT